jgi:hypothetical protein
MSRKKSFWDKPVPLYVWGMLHGIIIGIIISIIYIIKNL